MAPQTIKQWVTAQDGLEKLRLVEAEMPVPKEGEVLVKVNAVALNYRDTEVVMGLYGHHASISQENSDLIPCSDMCGIIMDHSTTASSPWEAGQRVLSLANETHLTGQIKESHMPFELGLPLPGVLTQYRIFPSSALIAAPDYLSDEEAATLPTAAVTAWMSINGFRPLGQPARDMEKRESVLLQGTGGVSVSGLQIARAAGMKAIITSSSDAKVSRAKNDIGADVGINYRSTPAWEEAVMDATDGHGADIIFENGGALTLRKSFDCIAFGGTINCIGYLSGKEEVESDKTHTNVLALRRNVTLKGILNGPKDRFDEMLGFYEEKGVRPVVDKVFGFEEAKEALKYLFGGGHFGKVVIKVN